MRKHIAVWIAIAGILIGSSVAANAQAGPGGPGKHGMGGPGTPMCDRMGPGKGMGPGMGMRHGMGPDCPMCDKMGRGMGPGMMEPGMMMADPKIAKELGITSDQKTKLKAIASNVERKSIRGEADMKLLHLDLRDLVTAEKPDAAKIDAKIDEIAAAIASQMKLGIHAKIDCDNVLTPEQREKLAALHEKKMRNAMKMRGDKKWSAKDRAKQLKNKKEPKSDKK